MDDQVLQAALGNVVDTCFIRGEYFTSPSATSGSVTTVSTGFPRARTSRIWNRSRDCRARRHSAFPPGGTDHAAPQPLLRRPKHDALRRNTVVNAEGQLNLGIPQDDNISAGALPFSPQARANLTGNPPTLNAEKSCTFTSQAYCLTRISKAAYYFRWERRLRQPNQFPQLTTLNIITL